MSRTATNPRGGSGPDGRHTIVTFTATVIVVATLSVAGVQTLLLVWLFGEHRKRRRAEEALRERLAEAQAQLVTITHLDRRAAIGEVSGAITHELNQPLEAILHNAEPARDARSRHGVVRRTAPHLRRHPPHRPAPPASFSGFAPCCVRKSSIPSPSTSTR
jgi:signal transduction histidine kinase